jgi:fructokinase
VAHQPVIGVIGEALIDLVIDGGSVTARPGGAGLNTATAIGRLGLAPVFLDRLSGDGFGQTLRATLERDGVLLGLPEPADVPTTLAVATVDESGSAHYGFYLEGTSAAAVDADALAAALPDDIAAVHTGTLALIMEPIGSAIEELITKELSPETVVMLDPNCRPSAIRDREAYLSRLTRIMRRADIVKVSTEDIEYLYPGEPAETAAGRLLGEGPTLVLVTDGPRPVRAFLPGRELSAEVPPVPIVDAIGAGDTFGGTFLALWLGDGHTRSDLGPDAEIGATLRLSIEAVGAFLSRAAAKG